MSTPRLVEAGPALAGVVAAVQRACFPDDPWSDDSVASLMGLPGHGAVLLVAGAEDAPEPLGFVLARAAAEDGEILSIGVHPHARGAGHGRRLVAAAERATAALGATVLFLEVAEDNTPARALYKACGFVAVGRRPNYYRRADGRVAALILRRDLLPHG